MTTPKRQTRVKNATKITIDKIDFGSKAEAFYYTLLVAMRDNNEIIKFDRQIKYELQPQFKKCIHVGCPFVFEKPSQAELASDWVRYKHMNKCPLCGHQLEMIREMSYVSDFDVTYLDGSVHVIDVKSSKFFQTEIFKLKKKIFEFKYPEKRLEMVFPKVPKHWNEERVI